MSNVKIQTTKNKTWIDASGAQVPYKFVPKTDRLKETLAAKIHKAAKAQEKSLQELFDMMGEAFDDVRLLLMEENEMRTRKGKPARTLTWHNFDRSIKVEANVNDICKWDEALMGEAKELIDDYIGSSMSENNELIAGLASEAFSNSKGMIDAAKVFTLLKYDTKIKDRRYQKACTLIKKAQQVDRTKMYMRVWEKDEAGEYQNINLNFSSL